MNAVEAAITELTEEIRQRQDALKALQVLRPEGNGVRRLGLPEPARAPAAAAPSKAAKRNGKKTWSRTPRTDVRDVVARLPEPFGKVALAEAVGNGFTEKAAESSLHRWTAKGLLVRIGPGQWRRSAKFGGAAGAEPGVGGAGAARRVVGGPALVG